MEKQQRSVVTTSGSHREEAIMISPDMGICDACAAEIADKGSRRYRYAFNSCPDCGARFTITGDSSCYRQEAGSDLVQCPYCRREYEDPANRRYQGWFSSCPACGPELCFYKAGVKQDGDPLLLFDRLIREGGIVAVKGLGGYHLACDVQNEAAVARLREKKSRYEKPFAVMMRDIDTVKRCCYLDAQEEAALRCAQKPIVLLQKKESCVVAEDTAPGSTRLGVMLPYTPLHCMIMENNALLVMTSANKCGCPTIYDDDEALFDLAEAVLTHRRKITHRMDDSVCMVVSGRVRLLRRARGYVPAPVPLKGGQGVVLALGAQQKNTFCLAVGESAFLSTHMGALDEMENEKYYASEIRSYMRLLDAKPEVIACDLHPDYVSTRFASRFKNRLPIYQIQHHHAHFASVLAEHQLKGNAVGLIFDGTGYGEDGTIWGGEALWGDISGTERFGHMLQAPLLGGEAAIHEPWRMALAVLKISCGEDAARDHFREYGDQVGLLLRASERGINSPMTSGAGRLFDAVAALIGIRSHTTYEGQAAIELEQAIDEAAEGSYGFDIVREKGMLIFDWRQLIRDIVRDLRRGCRSGKIAARYHRAVVRLLADISVLAKKEYACRRVVLSGGVFQNAYLLHHGVAGLQREGFAVYTNEQVPANDGGISFGQAAAVSQLIRDEA